MEIALGLDNDQDAEQTFRRNFPEADFIREDIQRVATRELDRVVEHCSDHPLWFSACAPCQPFSQQRRGMLASGDERSGVLRHLMRFVRRHRPEFVFIENVPGLRRRRIGLDVFEPITEGLERLGYYLKSGIVRSQDYGVPQRRARAGALGKHTVPRLFSLHDPRSGKGVRKIRYGTRLDIHTPTYRGGGESFRCTQPPICTAFSA